MSDEKITAYVTLFMVVGVVLFAVYDIFKNEGLRITAIMLPLMYFTVKFMNNYGVWSLWLKGKGFYFKSGIKGTIVQGPIPVQNNRVKYLVSVYAGYLSNEKKRQAIGGFWHFYTLISQRIVIPIIGKSNEFEDLPAENCDDPRGCIVYYGSPNRTPIYDENSDLREKISLKEHQLTTLRTIMKEVNIEIETLSKSHNKHIASAAKTIKGIVNQVQKPPVIVTPGAQGMVNLDKQE